MNYLDILDCDVVDGAGVRVTLFVSGCSHKCPGCHNSESWDASKGKLFTEATEKLIFEALDRDYIDGFTLSGGDPLFLQNRSELTKLCKKIKEKFPKKNIWLYTGYEYEDVQTLEIFNYVDVVVDGPFKMDLRDIRLAFKGSSNQRIIDIKKTKELNRIVTLEF